MLLVLVRRAAKTISADGAYICHAGAAYIYLFELMHAC